MRRHALDRPPGTLQSTNSASDPIKPFIQFVLRVTSLVWLAMGASAFAEPPSPMSVATTSQAPLTDAQQRDVIAQIEAVGRRGFLYEVSRPAAKGDGDDAGSAAAGKRLFLYGTIHLGRIDSEPFNGPVFAALRLSSRLALEADPSDAKSTQELAMRLGQYQGTDSLQRHVSPALMARVKAFGERNGMPHDRIVRFRPWLLANMVVLTDVAGAGLDPTMGSEMYLTGFARGMGLPVVEIEGLASQLHLLAGLPEALQNAQLEEALAELDSGKSQAQSKELFALWLRGDKAAGEAVVAQLHREAEGKAFERYFVQTLIDSRNRTMADKGENYLERAGNTFFAVGALHLFGEAGLIHEFERRGYRVVDLQPRS